MLARPSLFETTRADYRNFLKINNKWLEGHKAITGTVPAIRERQWHPAQSIKERRDGGLILEFKTNHINEVKDWVLAWGGGAKILEPAVLVEKITKDLRAALDNYKVT